MEEIERPRVVNARVAPFQTKENLFAQVVVRLHTKQVQIDLETKVYFIIVSQSVVARNYNLNYVKCTVHNYTINMCLLGGLLSRGPIV